MVHNIGQIINVLRETKSDWREPIVTEIAKSDRDAYKILISTIISLRTKDDVTRKASERLYQLADTPEKMLHLSNEQIERVIYPAGFYKNKAKNILSTSADIVNRYGGIVPDDIDELLTLDGVGRKTANLVITQAYGKLGICVDTHVHRISNRLGFVKTKNPTETEYALRDKLPEEYWIEYNDLLVAFGQNICRPISPLCSQCPIHNLCNRIGVTIHR